MSKRIAFIGLGRMGSGIASSILRRGMDVTVWNRTESKIQPLVAAGAQSAKTAKQAVANADIVVTSLMDDKSILETLNGENGILAGLNPGKTHLCVTTISPTFADELTRLHSAHGSYYVSGPVLGRPDAALAGELISYLAGDERGIKSARPVAETYSKSVQVVTGPASAANTIKLCINYFVVSLIEIIGEVYTFAEKSGADSSIVNEFYQAAFAHPALKMYGNKVLSRDFQSKGGFSMTGGLKDVTLVLQAAKLRGSQLDVGSIVQEKMNAAIDAGMSDLDWSAFTEITRKRASLD